MNSLPKILGISALGGVIGLAFAATFFDPVNQPLGLAADYAISKNGVADGNAKIYRPYFDDVNWWGDLESYDLSSTGAIAATPNWSAKTELDAMNYEDRRILTRRDDTGDAVVFEVLGDLSSDQEDALDSQAMLNYLRGDRDGEGLVYRERLTLMGDVIASSPVFIEYDPDNLASNLVVVGANDGMMHAFNASTGAEEFAYIPSEVLPNMPILSETSYYDSHTYFVNGPITSREILLGDGTRKRPLVGALGAGGQAIYALDITDKDVSTDAKLEEKLLWEISDESTGMADLGYTYSKVVIARVRTDSDGGWAWAAIFGNGYGSTVNDGTVGSGSAVLFVVDLADGSLIRKIDTGNGDADSPNGLSSPAVVDVNSDGIADGVFAGDLNGNLWRFDFYNRDPDDWRVGFGGLPFFTAMNNLDQLQPITTAPRVVRHPGWRPHDHRGNGPYSEQR